MFSLIDHGRIFLAGGGWGGGGIVLPIRGMHDDPNGSNDPGASRGLVSSG